jgi:hypothetical protein
MEMSFNAADLKIADGVYARDTGVKTEVSFRAGGDGVTITGTLDEVREAMRHLAATVGLIATKPQTGDKIRARTPRVTGRELVEGDFVGGGWPRSFAGINGPVTTSRGREITISLESAELLGRAGS